MPDTRVVVIGAHPDDEILGRAELWPGTSRPATRCTPSLWRMEQVATSDDMMVTLETDATRAAQLIESELSDIRPHVVYTHFPGDVNADHGLVARAAWTACRPYSRPQVRRFAVFETPSSTEWAWPLSDSSLQPNHFVDVSDTLEIKIAAMECYKTELRDYPHPRSSRALRERAAYWGSQVGRLAVEPFRILREVE